MAPSAQAGTWIRAESEHFVVTSDGSERTIRDYVRQLEVFRYLSLSVPGADTAHARAQGKFDIHVLARQRDMQKVRPEFPDFVAGVYFQCSEGSAAYSTMPGGERGSDPGLGILFHEYAHHMMFQYAKTYYPQWYVEGFAEYMAAAEVERGKITVDLKAYVAADETSSEAYHLLARALMASAKELDGDARATAAAQARAHFLKAYRLKKLDAPNLYHLAQALAATA